MSKMDKYIALTNPMIEFGPVLRGKKIESSDERDGTESLSSSCFEIGCQVETGEDTGLGLLTAPVENCKASSTFALMQIKPSSD